VREFVHDFNVDYRLAGSLRSGGNLDAGRDAIPQSFVIHELSCHQAIRGFNPMLTPPQIREALQEALNDKAAAD